MTENRIKQREVALEFFVRVDAQDLDGVAALLSDQHFEHHLRPASLNGRGRPEGRTKAELLEFMKGAFTKIKTFNVTFLSRGVGIGGNLTHPSFQVPASDGRRSGHRQSGHSHES